MDFPIKVAIDADLLMALTKWHEKEFFDKDGVLHKADSLHRLYPNFVKREIVENNLDIPEILNDRWLSSIHISKSLDKYYQNLVNVIYLYKFATQGIVQLCVNTAVYKHFKTYNMPFDFVDKYVKPVRCPASLKSEFDYYKNRLIKKYIDRHILGEPSTNLIKSAYKKIAMNSLHGTNMLVKRADIYLHDNPDRKDWERSNNIIDTNVDVNLVFENSDGRKRGPSAQSLISFITNLRALIDGENNHFFTPIQLNINNNFCFEPNVLPNFEDVE